MIAVCPAGHSSLAQDYCDVCGLAIDPELAPTPTLASTAPADATTSSQPGRQPCPNCGTDNPVDALVRCIVDGLFDVAIAQFNADGFGFNEKANLVVSPDCEIDIGAADREFRRHMLIFVVTENIREHVADDNDSVGFADVSLLCLL